MNKNLIIFRYPISPGSGSILLLFLSIFIFYSSIAQELSINDLPGDWQTGSTWDVSGNWDVGGGPTSGVNRWATVRGDITVSESLNYSHTVFSEGLTIEAHDTLTIFGDLTFTGAFMTLDIRDNGVLKIYGNFDTNGSFVTIRGDGVIVVSGNLTIDGGSVYSDNAGADDLYVDGAITGTGYGGNFDDLSTNHPVLYSEVTSELPVVLLDFKAESYGKGIHLKWTTASEENFDFFEVQRSADGSEYISIGQVKGHGNSSKIIHYNFKDGSPATGIYYYRLKAVDYDGSFEIFENKRVDHFSFNRIVNIYPNPVNQFTKSVRLDFQSGFPPQKVSILDARGNLLIQKPILDEVNLMQLEVPLPSGLYLIQIEVDKEILTQRLLID